MPRNIKFKINRFGGLNRADQVNEILARSYQSSGTGVVQTAYAEAKACTNIDFDPDGITKRKGSTLEDESLASAMGASEEVIDSYDYTSAATGQRITVVVTGSSIYTNQSGSFVKVNDSSSSAYSHSAAVSKCSFAVADGHLFIGLDGANKIQVYRSGPDLDDELDNNGSNEYEDAFGSGTNTIDGTWGTGYYLVDSFQGRLVYSDGNTVVNYSTTPTATDGVWKRSTHGFYQAAGNIVDIKSFTPDYQDSIQETLYIFTSSGPEITNDLSSQIQRIKGGPAPINHRSVVATKSWLMCLTNDRRIVAINRNVYIDIGRRFTDLSGSSEIEQIDISNSENIAFGFYNPIKEQVYFFAPGSTETENTVCFVIDLFLGEPGVGEPEGSYEKKVRLAEWKINEPDTNNWYRSLHLRRGGIVALTSDGNRYTFLNGRNDLDDVAIEAEYESLDFNGGVQTSLKNWILLRLRGRFIGNFTTTVSYVLDNSTIEESTTTYSQTIGGAIYGQPLYGQVKYNGLVFVKGQDDIDLWSESIRFKLKNELLNQTFSFQEIECEYIIGAEER